MARLHHGINYIMKSTESNENDILDRAILGDADAFSLLYEENVKKIYTYIYYRTGNTHDAEDLTARVFQRALKHITKYKKTKVPFSAWLYRIAHNLVANWHRDSKRKKELPLEDHTYLQSKTDMPEKQIEKNQEVDKLMDAIHTLPNDRQQLLILKYVEDLSNKEVGVIMKKSEGAIKSLYHRTLKELRQCISKNSMDA
jgi:RNA polymerase sigma-70 factor, ECF subfamily